MSNTAARARGNSEAFKTPVESAPVFTPIFNLKPVGDNDGPRSILAKSRIVKVDGPVNQDMADRVIAELLFHEAASPGTPITMLVNSGGGAVTQGWAIIDMMNMISSPVHTCAIGRVASMGTTILLAGAKGHRSATPNASIMMHEASISNVEGQAGDVAISAEEMKHTRARMLAFYAMTTGTSSKTLSKKMVRDYFMYPAEALELGVIDKIAGYAECKSAFNEAAQKSNEAHLAVHKRRGPALG
ncbi:MAG: hypothetical protein JWO78_1350 [Micavibrio sp.]|nr:hypothetical protein [Micavibrio sp.]